MSVDADGVDGAVTSDAGALVVATIVVFDDGTAAGTRTVRAARALDVPVDLDIDLRVVSARPDDATARRRALSPRGGSYLVWLESGVEPSASWLVDAVAVLRDDPTLGMVVPRSVPGAAASAGHCIDAPLGACAMRRTAWKAVGGIDTELGRAAWTVDLAWRIWLAGWRVTAGGGTVIGGEAPAATSVEWQRMAARAFRDPGTLGSPRVGRFSVDPQSRTAVQRNRRRPDFEIARLLTAAIKNGNLPGLGEVLSDGGIQEPFGSRRRVVVATADRIAHAMAGPAIRAWRIAHTLAEDHEVHLVTTGACERTSDTVSVEHVDHDRFVDVVEAADVVVFQGWIMADRPWLANSDKVLVCDVYDPMHLEQLEQGREAPPEGGRWEAHAGATNALNQQLRRGDYFLSASERQRSFWLGQASAFARTNQLLYDEDPALRERFAIVPFGIENDPPSPSGHAIRGVVPGIDHDAELVLWGGGIYNWFDPLTLIRAVDRLAKRRPRLRLYFLGTKHPNPEIPAMRMAHQARELAKELDLLDSVVYFNDGWVPYDERVDYFADADIGVSMHSVHIETEFSFRTRLLDYLWCGLPIVATEGDSFAPIIEQHGIGAVVGDGDVDDVEQALERLLADPAARAAAAAASGAYGQRLRWDSVLEPLRHIVEHATRAPDVTCPDTMVAFGANTPPPAWREDLDLARRYLREGGVRLFVDRVQARAKRLAAERRDDDGG